MRSFLLILLALVSPPAASHGQEHPRTDNLEKQKQKKQQPSRPVMKHNAMESQASEQKNQAYEASAKKETHDSVDRMNAYSTMILAVFTALMVLVFLLQLLATWNTQRAWIFADMETPPEFGTDRTIRLVCRITNRGNTPGWIIEMRSRGHTVRSQDELPETPEYGPVLRSPHEGSVVTPDVYIPQLFSLPADELARVERGETILYVYGFVKYRDIFKMRHETRYCFRFNPLLGGADPATRGFYVGGPDAYNTVT